MKWHLKLDGFHIEMNIDTKHKVNQQIINKLSFSCKFSFIGFVLKRNTHKH